MSAVLNVKVSSVLYYSLQNSELFLFCNKFSNNQSIIVYLSEQCYQKGRGKLNEGDKFVELNARKTKCNQCVCDKASFNESNLSDGTLISLFIIFIHKLQFFFSFLFFLLTGWKIKLQRACHGKVSKIKLH